jgi:hypothetical protein
LWYALNEELRDKGPHPCLQQVHMEAGSVWLGDSTCMHYLAGKRSKARLAPILLVLAQDLRYYANLKDEIAGGNKLWDYSRDGVQYPGLLTRVLEYARAGVGDQAFPPPLEQAPSRSLSTPSGWLGWVRLLALVHHRAGLPIHDRAHAQFLEDKPQVSVETLRSSGCPIPPELEKQHQEVLQRTLGSTRTLLPVDHWNAPAMVASVVRTPLATTGAGVGVLVVAQPTFPLPAGEAAASRGAPCVRVEPAGHVAPTRSVPPTPPPSRPTPSRATSRKGPAGGVP